MTRSEGDMLLRLPLPHADSNCHSEHESDANAFGDVVGRSAEPRSDGDTDADPEPKLTGRYVPSGHRLPPVLCPTHRG